MDAITQFYDFALADMSNDLIMFKSDYDNCFHEILANDELWELINDTDLCEIDKEYIWNCIVNKTVIACDG